MHRQSHMNGPRTRFQVCFATALLWPCFAHAQGEIRSWGSDDYGQVSSTPMGDDFVQVSAGGWQGLALRTDSSLVAWGRDDTGFVADTPTGTGFTQISTGRLHALALRADGSIAAWGSDYEGATSNSPAGTGHILVEAGHSSSFAIRSDGSIAAWGSDSSGVVSDAPVSGRYIDLATGIRHVVALRLDGSIVAWGDDFNGQVSNIPSGMDFVQVAASSNNGLALRSDGSLVAWGNSTGSFISNAPTGTDFVQVAVGGQGGLALRSDGSLLSWASNPPGAPTGRGYLKISSGSGNLSIVLRANVRGNAFCFGDGSGAPCPCAASGAPGVGCLNTTGTHGATLVGLGEAFLSEDSFRLLVVGVPGNKAGLILQGALAQNNGLGTMSGDGLLCVTGQTLRSQVQITSPGSASFASFLDFQGSPFGVSSYGAGVSTNYQFWYRDPGNTCSGAGFNFSNAWTVDWLP